MLSGTYYSQNYASIIRPTPNGPERNGLEHLTISRNGRYRSHAEESEGLMNTKSVVKNSVITTVYRARTTTSHISEASLAWETTPKQLNSSEIGIPQW